MNLYNLFQLMKIILFFLLFTAVLNDSKGTYWCRDCRDGIGKCGIFNGGPFDLFEFKLFGSCEVQVPG